MEVELQTLNVEYRLIGAKSMWEDDPLCLWVSALSEWDRRGLGDGLRSLLYWCGCNQADLQKLTIGMRDRMFWEADMRRMDLSQKGAEIAEALSHQWEQMRQTDWSKSADAAAALAACAEEIGARTGGSNVAAKGDEGLVSSKMISAAEILSRVPGSPRQRALWVKGLERRARESDARVKLVSMHSSKGLEFDSVYIINATERSLPGQATGADVEEERRVLYVAMTRAKNKLTVTFTQDSRNKPTPFLLSGPSQVMPIDADLVLEYAQAESRFAERATTG
ncbi:MAG: ATP-dependent helicase [Nevskiaceae bacterium]|nr:MAG: ATP-dependent helicase [Nevskiaceae bacterium]